MKLTLLFTALSVFTVLADDKKSAPAKPDAETKPAAEAKTADLTAGTLTFKAAAPWLAKKVPAAISKGGYTIPGKEGAAGVEADISVFRASDIDSNIKRWQAQFLPGDDDKLPEPKREDKELGGRKIVIATFKGTLLSGSVMQDRSERKPLPGYAMTGIIIPDGDEMIFVKIKGPNAAMTAAAENIKALVKSAFPVEK